MGTKLFECEVTDDGELVLRFHRPSRPVCVKADTRAHFIDARKEFLLGIRSMLDSLLEAVPEPEVDRRRRRREITLE